MHVTAVSAATILVFAPSDPAFHRRVQADRHVQRPVRRES